MSHEAQENQGTGLKDVFDILVKAPTQRLLSLTFQLGESPEDNIIHALCLIILQKEERALNRLQMLKDNYLASHLAEKWQMSGGKLDDFAVHCGRLQELTGESLAALARIFKVLSEQRLCDPHLRNLAYERALSGDSQKTNSCENLAYHQLREEAKVVCGPQFAECSSKDLKSGSYHDPPSSRLDEGTLKVTLSPDQSVSAYSLPSPLQATYSMPSYPTHLEISLPPTASFQGDKITPETSDESKLKTLSEPPLSGANKPSKMDESLATEGSKLDSLIAQSETLTQTTKPTAEPNFALPTATNIFLPKMPIPSEMHETKDAEEEEEAIFYAFVIFHAPEDADMAESIRENMERIIGEGEGATFSEDFAVPGKGTLRCVEDAINNSAFTILLLTRNFNTQLLTLKTDSALINSISKKHKYNTVIPLLPRENCMPKENLPMILKAINPLDENRSFERKIQRFLSPARIKTQRKIWTAEQTVKMQIERQERLKHVNQHKKQLIQEFATAQRLEREHVRLLVAQQLLLGPSVPPEQQQQQQQQHPNIHIENAQYIMIGNDSQMTVGLGAGAERDDLIYREEP
ncbi:TIR domain-containing adapter molecule 1 [Sebastes umbrosus]|uniref:TIR domain-containing adapter molecule 1 n=1 Tax=Sebastes umbrosus TaxID=72105 RepID=UPI00189CC399|nr:TIR domain-containing adapter molecule 1 [Sebastes umbrosus]